MRNRVEEQGIREAADQHQSEVLEAAIEAAQILLENGAEIFRVEETIDRMCTYYGVESESAFVLSNGIFVTTGSERERYYGKVSHIPVRGAQLNKVEAVNLLSREIEEGRYTIGEVKWCLKQIREMPGKTNRMQIFASGIGSGSFCYLFGGNLADSLVAFVSGCILYCFVLYVSSPKLSRIVGNITGGALVTALCILMYKLRFATGLSHMIIGSIIPLVPGVAFTNAIRDIANGDYISGSVRFMDAVLVFICIAMGVGLVFTVYNRVTGGILL